VGLPPADVVGRDYDLEVPAHVDRRQQRLDVVARGRRRDGARHALAGEEPDEGRRAGNRQHAAGGQARVVLALAPGQCRRLRGWHRAVEQVRHRLLGGPADGAPPEVGCRLDAEIGQQLTPGVAVMGAGVEEDAVHVEDGGGGEGGRHERRR
jgi:hypothetical protein